MTCLPAVPSASRREAATDAAGSRRCARRRRNPPQSCQPAPRDRRSHGINHLAVLPGAAARSTRRLPSHGHRDGRRHGCDDSVLRALGPAGRQRRRRQDQAHDRQQEGGRLHARGQRIRRGSPCRHPGGVALRRPGGCGRVPRNRRLADRRRRRAGARVAGAERDGLSAVWNVREYAATAATTALGGYLLDVSNRPTLLSRSSPRSSAQTLLSRTANPHQDL